MYLSPEIRAKGGEGSPSGTSLLMISLAQREDVRRDALPVELRPLGTVGLEPTISVEVTPHCTSVPVSCDKHGEGKTLEARCCSSS